MTAINQASNLPHEIYMIAPINSQLTKIPQGLLGNVTEALQ